jgi:ABC-type polysaccharide/polyol phosphate transport system ATPase subunit
VKAAATPTEPGSGISTEAPRRRLGERVIVADGVEKSFELPDHRPSTLKERALHPFRRIPAATVTAAKDINFDVKQGEFFGIVGRNGSGKSTLLRMIAGIYRPDAGKIEVRGRVSPFIELGVGFNGELAARDNVLINGTMLGLRRAEILERYPSIMHFAGLEEFESMKLKNYSSGMMMRLAFSTAIQVDASILLLDEVLAVGDAAFQEKCFEQFRRLKRDGCTIILVTHSMEAVRRFCDRALMLEHGRVVAIGAPDEIAETYREAASDEAVESEAPRTDAARFGDGSATARAAWVEDESGRPVESVEWGERMTLCAEFEFDSGAVHPVLGIRVTGERGGDVVSVNTLWGNVETPRYDAGERATLRIDVPNWLGVGAYTLTPAVASRDGRKVADIRFGLSSFRVTGKRWTGASVDLPYEIRLEPGRGPR